LLVIFYCYFFLENSLATNRKKTALKVLTNTVQSSKKSDGKGLKQLKVLPMKNFETEIKCKSPLQDFTYDQNEEFNHFDCTTQENGNYQFNTFFI